LARPHIWDQNREHGIPEMSKGYPVQIIYRHLPNSIIKVYKQKKIKYLVGKILKPVLFAIFIYVVVDVVEPCVL
jgi:hypothetical protein